jgi:hypothetical protein
MRAAQSGSHQFQRSRRATTAGARTPRMIVASMRMPPPSAVAKILASVPGWRAKATKATVVCLSHAADDEDLVVHRDAEEEGEDDDR